MVPSSTQVLTLDGFAEQLGAPRRRLKSLALEDLVHYNPCGDRQVTAAYLEAERGL